MVIYRRLVRPSWQQPWAPLAVRADTTGTTEQTNDGRAASVAARRRPTRNSVQRPPTHADEQSHRHWHRPVSAVSDAASCGVVLLLCYDDDAAGSARKSWRAAAGGANPECSRAS